MSQDGRPEKADSPDGPRSKHSSRIRELKHIYFDTNALVEGNWPMPNSLLHEVLTMAMRLGVRVIIPKPVEEEAEMIWLRKIAEAQRSFTGRTQGIIRHEVAFPSWDSLRDEYKVAVARIKSERGIETIRFTERPLVDAFRECFSHVPPYESIDGEFRDMIIYLSILEDLDQSPGGAALVTADAMLRGLVERRNDARTDPSSVRLIPIGNLESARRELLAHAEERLSQEDRIWKQRNDDRVRHALIEQDRANLERFLRIGIRFPSDFNLRVHSWSVEALDVSEIASSANRDTPDGARVSLSADIEVRIRGLMQPRLLYEGPHPGAVGLMRVLGSPEQYDVYSTVTVYAIATYHVDRYTDLDFKSMEVSSWGDIHPTPR